MATASLASTAANATAVDFATVDFKDIQGLVRFGYASLTDACFYLLNIRSAAAARAWLASATDTGIIADAVAASCPPQTAIQVAFTQEGLQAIGLDLATLSGFSAEFLAGMSATESRSRRLGDIAANAPEYWQWGAQGKIPHLLVMLYTQPGTLEAEKQILETTNWTTAFEVLDCLPTSNLGGTEPFGFNDGVSQPTLDWQRRRDPAAGLIPDQLEYTNTVALGEFLLGYPNEYGKYTQRPLLPANAPHAETLAFAEDAPSQRDLGRNGTYLVFRHLQQDVRGFWRFFERQAASNATTSEALAEAAVGRRKNGDPLLPLNIHPISGIDTKTKAQNNFTFDSDSAGLRCPLGAHVRRANPRNADLPPGSAGRIARLLRTLGFDNPGYRDDVLAATRFHRLLRRGREYGPALTPEQAISGAPDTAEHGIHFLCLCANILRQFEFVQNAWMARSKFDALTEESDPILGNREPIPGCPFTNALSLQQPSGVSKRLLDVPQFVTVRGGAYFFLPSLSALRYLAALDDPKP